MSTEVLITVCFSALLLMFQEENSQYFCILECNFVTGLDASLDGKISNAAKNQFQPIKFMNSVVTSRCETVIIIEEY